MKARRKQRVAPWRVGLSLVGAGFAAGALTLAAAQGQFSGGSRLTALRTVARPDASVSARAESGVRPEGATAADRSASGSIATSGTTSGSSFSGSSPSLISGDVATLRMKGLDVPVEGIARADVPDNFHQSRGPRMHEAVDILAPRNTPVRAVEDGRVAKLFFSNAGGITIYQFDPTEHYAYYYAHLDHYAPGLTEGQDVRRGQVIGYVGTSGNAPKNTPHLHFAIFKLNQDKRWWEGDALDPFLVFKP